MRCILSLIRVLFTAPASTSRNTSKISPHLRLMAIPLVLPWGANPTHFVMQLRRDTIFSAQIVMMTHQLVPKAMQVPPRAALNKLTAVGSAERRPVPSTPMKILIETREARENVGPGLRLAVINCASTAVIPASNL